jgi:glucan 1,3-beta-glucosidase
MKTLLLNFHSGIPYVIQNHTAQPWKSLEKAPSHDKPRPKITSCPALTPSHPSKYWYETITHNGESSFMQSQFKSNYKVFRNVVTDFGADNTGNTDASKAIQRAIEGSVLVSAGNVNAEVEYSWCF